MYKNEFEKLLISKKIPRSIFFYGKEDFLKNYYAKKALDIFGNKDEILSMFFDEVEPEKGINFLLQPSLFGGSNILHIRSDKNIPKADLRKLLDAVQKIQNSYLVFEFYGEDKTGKDIGMEFGKYNGADVRFFKPNPYEAIVFIKNLSNEIGLNIEQNAINTLLQIQNFDLALCAKELEKLKIFDKQITSQDVEKYTFGLSLLHIEDLIEKIITKKDIKQTLLLILEADTNEIMILNFLETYFYTLFKYHLYIKINGRYDSKEILGFNPPKNIEEKNASLAIGLKLGNFKKIFAHLLETEYEIKKNSNNDKIAILISSLIKLQTLF